MLRFLSRTVMILLGLQLLLTPVASAQLSRPASNPPTAADRAEQERRAAADRQATEEANKAAESLATDAATEVVNEVLFETAADLAGSACSLYGLGLDFTNFAWDGSWSFVFSLLDVTVLFRNQSWRELIWAVEDERKSLLDELTAVKKQRCVAGFAQPQAKFEGQEAQRVEAQLNRERKIAELEGRLLYLSQQRRSIQWDKPHFEQVNEPGFVGPPAPLQTDEVFYWLTGAPKMAWDQLGRDTRSFLQRLGIGLRVVVEQIPEGCFAVMNVGHELFLRFVHSVTFDNADGTYTDRFNGTKYSSFRDFIEKNQAAIATHYGNKCKAGQAVELPEEQKLPAEEQHKKLLEEMNKNIQETSKLLEAEERGLLELENKMTAGTALTPEEQEQLTQRREQRGIYLGMIDYFSLVINKVGGSTSQDLTALKKSLGNFVEAVLGVTTDNKGKKKSRLSLAERFQDSKERSLQKLCGRMKSMYQKAGRSTTELPTLGRANGKTYCKVEPECEGVNLANFSGGSEGLKKLAECSGFTFDEGELGPSQQERDVIQQTAEDLGTLLSQRSLNDLLVAQNLHFNDLYGTYTELYKAQVDTNRVLAGILKDIARGLYTNEFYNPNRTDSNNRNTNSHYAMMKHIYVKFQQFTDKQKGSCPAPKNPQG